MKNPLQNKAFGVIIRLTLGSHTAINSTGLIAPNAIIRVFISRMVSPALSVVVGELRMLRHVLVAGLLIRSCERLPLRFLRLWRDIIRLLTQTKSTEVAMSAIKEALHTNGLYHYSDTLKIYRLFKLFTLLESHPLAWELFGVLVAFAAEEQIKEENNA